MLQRSFGGPSYAIQEITITIGRLEARTRYWGRDGVLYLARRHCGIGLKELAAAAGGMRPLTTNMAIKRMSNRVLEDKSLAQMLRDAEAQM